MSCLKEPLKTAPKTPQPRGIKDEKNQSSNNANGNHKADPLSK